VHAEAQAGQRAAAEALRAAHSERDAALVRAGAADRRVAQLETELADAKVQVTAAQQRATPLLTCACALAKATADTVRVDRDVITQVKL